jgi:hypothetical protein
MGQTAEGGEHDTDPLSRKILLPPLFAAESRPPAARAPTAEPLVAEGVAVVTGLQRWTTSCELDNCGSGGSAST